MTSCFDDYEHVYYSIQLHHSSPSPTAVPGTDSSVRPASRAVADRAGARADRPAGARSKALFRMEDHRDYLCYSKHAIAKGDSSARFAENQCAGGHGRPDGGPGQLFYRWRIAGGVIIGVLVTRVGF